MSTRNSLWTVFTIQRILHEFIQARKNQKTFFRRVTWFAVKFGCCIKNSAKITFGFFYTKVNDKRKLKDIMPLFAFSYVCACFDDALWNQNQAKTDKSLILSYIYSVFSFHISIFSWRIKLHSVSLHLRNCFWCKTRWSYKNISLSFLTVVLESVSV